MGNVQSTENGGASLAGLEALIVNPSTILGEAQQEFLRRTQIAAQASTPNTNSARPSSSNPQAVPLLVSSSIEPHSGLHIPYAAGPNRENQFREAEPEILEMLNPLALFRSNFIDGDEEPLPPTQTLALFDPTSGYINFLIIILYIYIYTLKLI